MARTTCCIRSTKRLLWHSNSSALICFSCMRRRMQPMAAQSQCPLFRGTGKSTLTLALAEHGLEYLSDELAPVDLERLTVAPYPHAVCLKSAPPPPYDLPQGTLNVNAGSRCPWRRWPRAPDSIHCLWQELSSYAATAAGLTACGPSPRQTGATRLMAHLLNGLAHPNYGLDPPSH